MNFKKVPVGATHYYEYFGEYDWWKDKYPLWSKLDSQGRTTYYMQDRPVGVEEIPLEVLMNSFIYQRGWGKVWRMLHSGVENLAFLLFIICMIGGAGMLLYLLFYAIKSFLG